MLREHSPINRIIFFCSLIFLLCTPHVHAQTENIGFVEGLWYAHEPVFADTETRVYVAFRNNATSDLTATIRFTDNGKRIGSSEVHALSGRLVEAWVDWKPTFGEHTVTASLENATLHAVGLPPEKIDTNGFLVEDTLTIDYDTDEDGIGNASDTDDDNDTVSDEVERERGTNPLIANPKSIDKPKDTEKETEDTELQSAIGSTNPIAEISDEHNEGLEKYAGEGVVKNLLGNVTEKVHNTKSSLDTYRTERNEKLYTNTQKETGTSTDTTSDTATITRTKIETNNSFLQSFIDGLRSILENLWTLVLFIVSKILTHPALIQVLLLIGILYIFYRLLRSVGRRPNT